MSGLLKHVFDASSTDGAMQEAKWLQAIFSAGRQFYAVPEVRRECGIWLSIEKHPLPVPVEWRRPHSVAAAVMPGRNYYRIAIFGPQHTDGSKSLAANDELVRDYCDAAWWTPGLEEAWEQQRQAGEQYQKREAELRKRLAETQATAEGFRRALKESEHMLAEVAQPEARESLGPRKPALVSAEELLSALRPSSDSETVTTVKEATELSPATDISEEMAGIHSSDPEGNAISGKERVRPPRGRKNGR